MTKQSRELTIIDDWLDGHSVYDISMDTYENHSSQYGHYLDERRILAIINSHNLNELFRDDPRVQHGFCAKWVYSEGAPNAATGITDAFIIVFHRREREDTITPNALQKIAEDLNQINSKLLIDTSMMEILKMKDALKFISENSYLAWIIEDNGETIRYDGRYHPTPGQQVIENAR